MERLAQEKTIRRPVEPPVANLEQRIALTEEDRERHSLGYVNYNDKP